MDSAGIVAASWEGPKGGLGEGVFQEGPPRGLAPPVLARLRRPWGALRKTPSPPNPLWNPLGYGDASVENAVMRPCRALLGFQGQVFGNCSRFLGRPSSPVSVTQRCSGGPLLPIASLTKSVLGIHAFPHLDRSDRAPKTVGWRCLPPRGRSIEFARPPGQRRAKIFDNWFRTGSRARDCPWGPPTKSTLGDPRRSREGPGRLPADSVRRWFSSSARP